MSRDYHMKTTPGSTSPATYQAYVIGFILSLVFTLSAYGLVVVHVNSGHRWPGDQVLLPIIIVLALAQFIVQLMYFLHIGTEPRPRWKLLVFGFMTLVVAILVFGSLWIMNNLNYHSSARSTDTYIIKDEGIHK